jgi:flagellar motility protein MotE (MotC chaperone)
MASRKRKAAKGTLWIIALLLISSSLVRMGVGMGTALAQASEEDTTAAEMAEKPEAIANETQPVATDVPPTRAEIGSLLDALQKREARVKELEKQIDMRSKALAVADAEIERRLQSLTEAEENLRRTLALADGAAEEDLARLTSVYENMKPKDAAALFEAMEPEFAAGFLGRMRPDAAAAVMAGLAPATAYSISVILAGRNATAPKT